MEQDALEEKARVVALVLIESEEYRAILKDEMVNRTVAPEIEAALCYLPSGRPRLFTKNGRASQPGRRANNDRWCSSSASGTRHAA
jgi:hypothetical protein